MIYFSKLFCLKYTQTIWKAVAAFKLFHLSVIVLVQEHSRKFYCNTDNRSISDVNITLKTLYITFILFKNVPFGPMRYLLFLGYIISQNALYNEKAKTTCTRLLDKIAIIVCTGKVSY